MRPAACNRRVIVHEDVGTIVDWFAVEDGFNQYKRLAVLIAGGVRQFVVGAGELPIEKPDKCAPVRLCIGRDAGRKKSGNRIGIGPVLDDKTIAGIVPRRKTYQG